MLNEVEDTKISNGPYLFAENNTKVLLASSFLFSQTAHLPVQDVCASQNPKVCKMGQHQNMCLGIIHPFIHLF